MLIGGEKNVLEKEKGCKMSHCRNHTIIAIMSSQYLLSMGQHKTVPVHRVGERLVGPYRKYPLENRSFFNKSSWENWIATMMKSGYHFPALHSI